MSEMFTVTVSPDDWAFIVLIIAILIGILALVEKLKNRSLYRDVLVLDRKMLSEILKEKSDMDHGVKK